MDPLAVLTHEADVKKWVLRSPALFPVTAIIDPTVQFSLPGTRRSTGPSTP